jgi:hypothetical protein
VEKWNDGVMDPVMSAWHNAVDVGGVVMILREKLADAITKSQDENTASLQCPNKRSNEE